MRKSVALLAALAVLAFAGVLGFSSAASATSQKVGAQAFNPALTGPPPPSVVIPGNCPSFLGTDAWQLNFISGNGHFYGTQNKNGDWGGGNATGQAVFTTSDGTTQYTGHLHEWFGGGQNSPSGSNQTVTSFTFVFQGSGAAGNLAINANMHTTTNNHGVVTANVFNANVRCS